MNESDYPSVRIGDGAHPARTEPRPPVCAPPVSECAARTEPRPPVCAPNLPERKTPSKNSVKISALDNRSVILYVTICTTGRVPVLTNPLAFDCIVAAFRSAMYWHVGKFIVMPDHIHFFCGPGTWPPYDFHKWVSFLKSSISRTFPLSLRERIEEWNTGGRGAHGGAPSQVRARCAHHLFQMQCWDTQIRTGDHYARKWEYTRNNPVRKSLVSATDDWPYQGEINVLEWHD